jgi:hypothetical protein
MQRVLINIGDMRSVVIVSSHCSNNLDLEEDYWTGRWDLVM